ncbi:MAG TPA: hypothetical protein VFV52_16675 [Bacilli bacterium]|nr:hypothetical protein [Bacilli bacterium]
MIIGIIATCALLLLIFWQVGESRKSSVLRIAREEYEDHVVRYEGLVTYEKGPLQELVAGSDAYLSILEGVVCFTSKQRDFHAIEADKFTQVASEVQGGKATVTLHYTDERGPQEIRLTTKPERAQMIERSIPVA